MGQKSLGQHLIIDVWGEVNGMPFWDMDGAAVALKQAVLDCGATIMTERWHHFGTGFGYTGVIVLAESHASVHTYNEHGNAMIDVFTCGDCDPLLALPAIKSFYKTDTIITKLIPRGIFPY